MAGIVYTQAKMLYDGDNNLMPQYLDPDDKTDSPEGTFKPYTKEILAQIVGGQLGISNLPAVQNVAGTLQVENFPTTQNVAGTVGIQGITPDAGKIPVKGEMQLSGRNVEEVKLWDALAITSTAFNSKNDIDLSKYKEIRVLVNSTLNQDITVDIKEGEGKWLEYWNGTAWAKVTMVIPKTMGNSWYDLTSRFPELKRGILSLDFVAYCSTAPTTGNFSLKIVGVIN